MPKLDVGVGDEFPAKEVKDEPKAQAPREEIHHHYHHRRYRDPRYRGRWLWFVLWIMVVTLVFRMFDAMIGTVGWGWSHTAWGSPWGSWGGWGPFEGWRPIEGMLTGILIIGGLIFMMRWRARDEEHDRDEDGR